MIKLILFGILKGIGILLLVLLLLLLLMVLVVLLSPIAQYSPLLPPVGVWTVSQFQCGRSPSQVGY